MLALPLFGYGSSLRKSRVIYARMPMTTAQRHCANIDNLGDGWPPSTRTSTRALVERGAGHPASLTLKEQPTRATSEGWLRRKECLTNSIGQQGLATLYKAWPSAASYSSDWRCFRRVSASAAMAVRAPPLPVSQTRRPNHARNRARPGAA
jgi:hypothetical protein